VGNKLTNLTKNNITSFQSHYCNSMNTLTRPRELSYTDWTLIEPEFDPAKLRARETVFTIGNGYLGTRGSFEEGYPAALPATLVHRVYDDMPGVYTELANCPDWLSLTLVVNGERFRLDSAGRTLRERGEILHYEQQLDLQHGILSRWRSLCVRVASCWGLLKSTDKLTPTKKTDRSSN
jgi:trehalose/maltose hydrolase-like predicted phosphorylase